MAKCDQALEKLSHRGDTGAIPPQIPTELGLPTLSAGTECKLPALTLTCATEFPDTTELLQLFFLSGLKEKTVINI